MKINIISNLREDVKVHHLFMFNHIVAWSLHKALKKRGIKARLVADTYIDFKAPPKADHAIIVSGKARSRWQRLSAYRKRIRKTTKGKVALYLDADFSGWHAVFDYVFTVVKPVRKNPRYVYAGWGADPKLFYPGQKEKAVFVDCLMYGKYGGRFNKIYDVYRKVFSLPKKLVMEGNPINKNINGIKLFMPLPVYKNRIYWPQMQETLRKCHFYCCTQLGESGLTRIEAATCGALLVVPKPLYRPRTMASLDHAIWSTRKELEKILKRKTKPKQIRKKALKHSWNLVAKRIIKRLAT
ncbi:hypothetical protein ES702_00370 [subsurface metagenome]